MPFGKDNYNYTLEQRGYEGQIATNIPSVIRGQYYSNRNLPIGAMVALLPDGTIDIPSGGRGEILLGVNVVYQRYEQIFDSAERPTVPKTKEAQIMVSGEVYVFPEIDIDISAGKTVYFRPLTAPQDVATGALRGRFRSDNDGGAAIELPNARWVESGKALEPTRLFLHYPSLA